MTPEEYQAQRAEISLGLRGVLLPLIQLVTPGFGASDWAAWVASAYPAVYRARVDHWRLAQQYYREERERVLGEAGPIDFPRRNYGPADLNAGLDEIAKPRLEALEEGDPVPQVIVEEIADTAQRHASAGGREAMVDAARHDEGALGYARVTVGLENCAFCLMLVSRGPVYKSESNALLRDGTSEPYHPHCDCIAVPVYDRQDWQGRDEYREMASAWQEHGGDLTTWRRWVEDREQPAEEQAA